MDYLNKVSILQLKNFFANNRKYPYLIIFSIGVLVRVIPELEALPFPIGYDVINYYLPVLVNFDNHWASASNQFPLYVALLHVIISITHFDPRLVVTATAVFIFGLFSVVVYSIAKNNFHLSNYQSIFLSLFVIFQVSVLRTSWDLHKDMLALTITLYCLSYLGTISNASKRILLTILPLSIISVLSDRMIGFLLTLVYILYSLIKRERMIAILATVTAFIFAAGLFNSIDTLTNNIMLGSASTASRDALQQSYNSVNLGILFLVMCGILLPSGVIGFMKAKITILKIPLIISLLGSFTWIIFAGTSALLPDRWIIIFSIFLSIFSGYGFIMLIESKRIAIYHKKLVNYLVILIPFLFLGSVFATSPNGSYLNLYGLFHEYMHYYDPMTMQYNSISIPESESLVSLIDWMNHNTPSGSLIVGSKHLRGWMELDLKNRSFLFSDNITNTLHSNKYAEFYLLDSSLVSNLVTHELQNYSSTLSYNNTNYSLYHLKSIE
jgi:hypothetical protein